MTLSIKTLTYVAIADIKCSPFIDKVICGIVERFTSHVMCILGVLNPSLVPVRPFSSGTASLDTIIREVQEFPPLEEYHPHPHYHISLTYTHYLYLYPLSLKYDSQRNFTKVSLCLVGEV